MNGEGLIIQLEGDDFELTRYNTQLYTFFGRIAIKNHVFVITREDDETVAGVHIWEAFQTEPYTHIKQHIEKYKYPQYLNLTEIAECDELAFERALQRQIDCIEDFIPDEYDE